MRQKQPSDFAQALWQHRELLWQLSKRSIESRYRGSLLGRAWSLITPLLMLAVYTFVFSSVFRARWGDLQEIGPLAFAINLFTGLIVFNLFSEVLNQSPDLMLRNSNLVTKVVFPLELLPAASVISALFNATTSVSVLILFQIANSILGGEPPHIEILWLPLIWTPLLAGCLALSWITSALGVYLRDLGQITNVATNLLLFMSAVFYPLSALPVQWQPVLFLNPLVPIIEQTRLVVVTGRGPGMNYLTVGFTVAIIACEMSYRFFRKARRGFADVL